MGGLTVIAELRAGASRPGCDAAGGEAISAAPAAETGIGEGFSGVVAPKGTGRPVRKCRW